MEQVAEKKWSKLAIVSFILTLLFPLFFLITFNLSVSKTSIPDTGFLGLIVFIFAFSIFIFPILFIMNIVSLIICIKKRLKGKILSIIGIIISFVLFMLFYIRKTRTMIFALFVKLPVVSKVMNQIDVARFARTLSTLLKSGVPIMVALDVSSDVIAQPKLKKEAKIFSEGVSKGKSLSEILSKHKKLFPATMTQTIKAGEKTGSLEVVLEEMASFYEMEVDYSLKRATALLEPVLMLDKYPAAVVDVFINIIQAAGAKIIEKGEAKHGTAS